MSITYKSPEIEIKKRRRNVLIDSNKDDEEIANSYF